MPTSDRAPLAIAPTHIPGLVEFERTECGHPGDPGHCTECLEFASRGQIRDAIREVGPASDTLPRRTARIGQTVLDADELLLLLTRLDEYDRNRRAS